MITKSVEKLLSAALAVTEQTAIDYRELGFMARAMTLCTMPHSKPKGNEFRRKNGNYLLTMYSPHGLPYGSIPRLLLAWLTTEAVRTKSPTMVLGHSLSGFMRQLDMEPTGGKTGSITGLREQMKRLFSTTVTCSLNTPEQDSYGAFQIVQKHQTWWDVKQTDQAGLWGSTLTLPEEFFREITQAPVPIDTRALKALRRSPLALDVYIWLTFRTSYLKSSTVITWEQLQMQFGAEYGRVRDFRKTFTSALRKVRLVYPGANVTITASGILVKPGKTSIPKKGKTLLTD